MSAYEIPAYGSNGLTMLGWLLEAFQESQGWLQTQRPSGEWQKVLDSFMGQEQDAVQGLSNLGYDLVERNARDIVASLSNFRHEGEYQPTFDKALYNRAHILTKIDRAWAKANKIYNVRRANLQNAVAFGTGYLVTDWDKTAHGTYGDIRERAFAPSDVTFVQMPKDHDIQKTYMTIIREELPINLAKRVYPNAAGALVPDRDAPGWIQKGLQKVQRLMGGSPALAVAGMGQRNQTGSFPTTDIFHAYIMDASINTSGQPMQMGIDGTNWSYTVPSLGDPMDTGMVNPATGQHWTVPAKEEDCLLFPLRRYVIFTRTAVLYDGSSPWWHGATPVARLRFNDWAWEALGRSLMAAPMSMQESIIAHLRNIDDAGAARLDPPALFDDTLVSEGFANGFNPRMAGVRAAAQLNTGGDVLKFPVPVDHYNVPPYIPDHVKGLEERINHQMGVPDLVAMAKAKQVPGQGTLEKLLEMAGPLVDDMVRAQEVPYTEGGEWRKALYFQFYTRARFIKIAGPDPDSEEGSVELEYHPDLLLGRVEGESLAQRQDRAKGLISEFTYQLEESSINERHRMSNRLALLQLKKAGVKADDWSIAKAFNLSNYGPKPEGTRNMMERWIAEQHMNRELSEELGAGQAQGQKGPGRPQTNQKPAHIQSKDGGTRSTVSTS